MSVFNGTLTSLGRELQAKAQTGVPLKYTKFMVGDGKLGSQSVPALTKLVNPLYTFDIKRLRMTPPDQAMVGFVINPNTITTGFYLREVGLFATDPDRGEILYWYANAGDTSDYQPPGDGSPTIVEKNFDIYVFIGSATNVTAVIDSSLVYATPQDVADALEQAKEYTDEAITTKVPDASLTKKGIVQLSSATNSTSETLAATPKAVKTVYDYAYDAYRYRGPLNGSIDDATTPGFYNVFPSDTLNSPSGTGGDLSVEFFSNTVVQKFITYGFPTTKLYVRSKYQGTWTPWTELFSTRGGTITGDTTITNTLRVTGLTTVENNLHVTGQVWAGRKTQYGATSPLTLPIGDSDTGFHWNADGNVYFYSNNQIPAQLLNGDFIFLNTSGSYESLRQAIANLVQGVNEAKQSGVDFKNKVAGAINSKGGSASAGMTGDQLAAAIRAMTGRVVTGFFGQSPGAVAIGTGVSVTVSTNNLAFTPRFILVKIDIGNARELYGAVSNISEFTSVSSSMNGYSVSASLRNVSLNPNGFSATVNISYAGGTGTYRPAVGTWVAIE